MSRRTFESLANETFLDLFEYFSLFELLQSFSKLNSRFGDLIVQSFNHQQLNFRSFSLEQINELFLHNEIPFKSLILSPNDDQSFPFAQFIDETIFCRFDRIQSVRLSDFNQSNICQSIGFQLKNLRRLIDLKIDRCVFPMDDEDFLLLTNQIWSCEHLSTLLLNISRELNDGFVGPTIPSKSLRSFVLSNLSIDSNELTKVFLQTPQLECFHLFNDQLINSFGTLPEHFHLKKLVLTISINDEQVLRNFLENQQNLRELIIDLSGLALDGHQWESIIRHSLRNLQNFHFRQEFSLNNIENNETIFNEYFQTFENSFWLVEHRWFIQCQWVLTSSSSEIFTSTIPMIFSSVIEYDSLICRTTYPSKSIQHDSVRHLLYQGEKNDLSSLGEKYPNIISLDIQSAMTENIFLSLNTFRQLKQLKLSLKENENEENIVEFPSSSSRKSLEIVRISETSLTTIFNVFKKKNLRIKHFCLENESDAVASEEQISSLIHLCCQIHCEILSFDIRYSANIRRLINEIPSLKNLSIRSQDDLFLDDSSDDQHFLQFLRASLPSDAQIFRDFLSPEQIQIFLRHR